MLSAQLHAAAQCRGVLVAMRRREMVALIEEGRVRRGDPTIWARGPRGRAGEEVERGHGWAQHFGLPSGIAWLGIAHDPRSSDDARPGWTYW